MKSIRQTVQIAGAQKLISASRIGKARRMLDATLPYHGHIRERIAYVLALCPEVSSRYLERGSSEGGRPGLLVLTSNTGLAGGYNANILKLADQYLAEAPDTRLIVMGQVGRSHFSAAAYDREADFPVIQPSLFTARELAEYLSGLFQRGDADRLDVAYTRYDSAVRLTPVLERLFPLRPEAFGHPVSLLPVAAFEPDAEAVFSTLMASYLKGFLYGCLTHAWVSELASRIAAMDSAIRNGNDMLDRLSLLYNRARQAAITQEISEIVAGATSIQSA
jgi:F-type H+-transporting ATPase subunit gamma